MLTNLRTLIMAISLIGLLVVSCMSSPSVQLNDTPQPTQTSSITATKEVEAEIISDSVTQTPRKNLIATGTPRSSINLPIITPQPTAITIPAVQETAAPPIQSTLTTPINIEGSAAIAFIQNKPSPPNSLLILAIGSTSNQHFLLFDNQPVRISRSETGCQLYVLVKRPFGMEMIEVDFQENLFESVFQYHRDDPLRESEIFHDEWEVSPSGSHIAYIVFAGEHY